MHGAAVHKRMYHFEHTCRALQRGRHPAHSKITRAHSLSDTGVLPCAGWRAKYSAGHGGVKTRCKQVAYTTDGLLSRPAEGQTNRSGPSDRPAINCQSEQSQRFWAVKPGRQRDRRGAAKESPVGLSSTSPPLDKHSFEASTQRSPPPYPTRRHRPQSSLYTTYTPYNRPLSCKLPRPRHPLTPYVAPPMCAPSDPTQSARQPDSQHHQQIVSRNAPRFKSFRRERRQRCRARVAVSGGLRRTSHPSFPTCRDLIASARNWHHHVRRVLGISAINFNDAHGNIAPITCLR
jgi:hypothetical protein